MQRLFIAINCNDEIKAILLSVQEIIKAQSIKGSFSRPENLHLTLVFLGETPEEQIPGICSVIDEAMIPPLAPFTLTFSPTGCFRHSHKELWWIGVERSDPSLKILERLRRRIIEGLSAKSIVFDERPFKAHITLGREIKHDAPIEIPERKISFPVSRLSLMKSERVSGILVYTEIFDKDLSG